MNILRILYFVSFSAMALLFGVITTAAEGPPRFSAAIGSEDLPEPLAAPVQIGETGTVALSDTIDQGVFATVVFGATYTNPVVVAFISTRGGGEPVDVRVRNITTTSCEIFMQEPDNQAHASETVSYIVMEAGRHNFDGLVLEAGTASTSSVHVGGAAYAGDGVSFSSAFSGTPAVLATLNTHANNDFMSVRAHGTSTTGFTVQQEAAETGKESTVTTESVGWIALSTGTGSLDGSAWEVGTASDGTNDGVTETAHGITFSSFSGTPVAVVSINSTGGSDGGWARGEGTWNSTTLNVYAEEDLVGDAEQGHGDETFAWAAFDSGTVFNTTCFADYDGDDVTDFVSGDASALRDAVAAVSAGGTVRLAGTCTGVVLDSGSTQVVRVDKNVTLAGGYDAADWSAAADPSSNPTTLDANSAGRVLFATGSATIFVQDLILSDGDGTGAGVDNNGGAVRVDSGVSLNLDGCTLENSSAEDGGGLYNSGGAVSIGDSTISGNGAGFANNGGGVALSGGTVDITGSTITGNSSAGAGGGISNADGTLTVTNSTVSGNYCLGYGGGVFQNQSSGTSSTMLTHVTVTGNQSDSLGNGNDGGGVANNAGTFVIENSIVAGNISDATDNDCRASAAITSNGGNLFGSFTDCNFNLGTDAASATPGLSALADNGGPTSTHALQSGSPAIDLAGTLNGCGSTITDDQRDYPRMGNDSCDSGAYESCPSFPATVTTSLGLRSAITCANDETLNPGSDTINIGADITLTVVDNYTGGNNGLPAITSDIVIDGGSFTLERDAGAVDPFRIFCSESGGSLTISDLTIQGGIADDTGASSNDVNGGGIYARRPLTLTNVTLTGNQAANRGGGIFAVATVILTDVTLTGNQGGSGGGMSQQGTLTATNLTVESNTGGSGAGLALFGGTKSIANSTIQNNVGTGNGAIFLSGPTVTFTNSIIRGNSANNGAAIYISIGTINLLNSTVTGNDVADGNGFSIALNGASGQTFNAVNSTISGNSHGLSMGTIGIGSLANTILWGNGGTEITHASSGTLTLTNNGIEGGVAGITGGGPVVDSGGNLDFLSSDTVFVAPVASASAPTDTGDYHLSDFSVALNVGDNTSAINAGLTTDFEGDNRFLETTVDMGADESDRCGFSFPTTVSTADALRTAISCANDETLNPGSDTINIGADITLTEVDNTIEGNNGLPSVTSEIVLDGGNFTLERDAGAGETFRLVHISNPGNLTLKNVTLKGGIVADTDPGTTRDDDGGGLYTYYGDLTLTNVTFLENQAASRGGGATIIGTGNWSASGLLVSGNSASFGGGLYVAKHSDISSSLFANNIASNQGAGIYFAGTGRNYRVRDSTIYGNSCNAGSAFGLVAGSLEIFNSVISGNEGTDTTYLRLSTNLTVVNTTISGNSGSVYIPEDVTATFSNTLFWGNGTAEIYQNSTVALNITSCGIEGGVAGITGGGVVVENGINLTLLDTDDIFEAPVPYDGGNTPNTLGDYHLSDFSLALNVGDNTSATNAGLTLDFEGDNRFLETTVDMGADESDRCGFSFPTTVSTADALRTAITCANDETLNPGSDTINIATNITLAETDNVLNGNNGLPVISSEMVVNGNGYTVERDSALADTVATGFRLFYVNSSGDLTLNDLTLQNGYTNGGGITDSGGAILNDAGVLVVNNTTITENYGGGGGGGIYSQNGTLTLDGVTITSNLSTAGGVGAGVFILNGTLSISDSVISGNQSIAWGAGVSIVGATTQASIVNTIISGNEALNPAAAGGLGGGVYTQGITTITNSTISGNRARASGGGIHVASSGDMTLLNSIVWGNLDSAGTQIDNAGTLDVGFTGIEDGYALISNTGTLAESLGGNMTLGSGDTVFVNPVSGSSAPTDTGDYHLSDFSVALNVGDNTSATNAGLTLDFEGDNRFLETTVDMGADEKDRCTGISFPAAVSTGDALRIAIICANENATADTINISADITLTEVDNYTDGNNGVPAITSDIVINGGTHVLERDAGAADPFRIIYVGDSGTLEINDLTIQGGSAQDTGSSGMDSRGGGLANKGPMTLTNVTIRGNQSANAGGGLYGDGAITGTNLLFENNSGSQGGAWDQNRQSVTFTDVVFQNNTATNSGGAAYINTTNAHVVALKNAIIRGNSADNSAAIHLIAGSDLIINNSIISGNNSSSGSGYSIRAGSSATLTMVNSTVSGNSHGILGYSSNAVTLSNTILWGNGTTEITHTSSANLTLTNNGIEGGLAGITGGGPVTDNGGNLTLLNTDDVFIAPVDSSSAPTITGDYHLSTSSVVIDLGDDASATGAGLTYDIDGDDRILQNAVDMGADETVACSGACPTCPGPDLSPVGAWHFQEGNGLTASDSANGNAGAIQGTPNWSTGVIGNGLTFDGSSNYVDIGNPVALQITGSITVMAWIRVAAFDNQWQAIVTKGDSSYRLHRNNLTNEINFATNGVSPVSLAGSINVNDGNWHHVAGVWDQSTGTRTIYVDGAVDVQEVGLSGSLNSNGQNVAIGQNLQATGRHWNGDIDEAAIYDSALTDSEILSIYQYGIGDGVPYQCDVCPEQYDPGQIDTDSNGMGDICDPPNEPSSAGATPLEGPDAAWIIETQTNATHYIVYEKALGSWYGSPTRTCLAEGTGAGTWTNNGDGTVTLNYTAASDSWISVSTANSALESSAGLDSAAAERNASASWTPGGTCP